MATTGEGRATAFKLLNEGDLDWWTGGGQAAWESRAAVIAGIPVQTHAEIRKGRTVKYYDTNGTTIIEAWWRNGVTDNDLIVKSQGDVGTPVTVDNIFNPESTNPQAGTAVKQAIDVATSQVDIKISETKEEVSVQLVNTAKKNEDVFNTNPLILSIANKIANWNYLQSSNAFLTVTGSLSIGANVHTVTADAYQNVPQQIASLKELGIVEIRINVANLDANGKFSPGTEALWIERTFQAFHNEGIKCYPVIDLVGLDIDNDTYDSAKAKGVIFGTGFANSYGYLFTHIELGNELDNEIILAAQNGDQIGHYDAAKLQRIKGFIDGTTPALRAKGIKTVINCSWKHWAWALNIDFDVIAWHWYSDMESNASAPANIAVQVKSLFPGKEIWFNEVNQLTTVTDKASQRTWLTNFATKLRAVPEVTKMFIYELYDEPTLSGATDQRFGIVEWNVYKNSFKDTTAAKSFISIISQSASDTVTVNIQNMPDGKKALLFVRQTLGGVAIKFSSNISGARFIRRGAVEEVSKIAKSESLVEFIRWGNTIIFEIMEIFIPIVEEPGGTVYTAAQAISTITNAGAENIDSALFTEQYNQFSDFFKNNATLLYNCGADKNNIVYGFDRSQNRAVEITFRRTGRGNVNTRENYLKVVEDGMPRYSFKDTYEEEVQTIVNSMKSDLNASGRRVFVKDYLPAGYVTNGTVEYTTQVNNAIKAGTDIIFPNFPVLVSHNVLYIQNGKRYYMEDGGELWLRSGVTNVNYRILTGDSSLKGATLINMTIRGDWGHGHDGALSYEMGQGIHFFGSQNVVHHKCYIYDCFGDGAYLTQSSVTLEPSKNIRYYRCVFAHNGRNGCSIVSAEDILFVDCRALNNSKANPMAGWDVEPISNSTIKNVTWINPSTNDNLWTGIQIGMSNMYNTGGPIKELGTFLMINHFNRGGSHHVWISADNIHSSDSDSDGVLKYMHMLIHFQNYFWYNSTVFVPAPNNPSNPGVAGPIQYTDPQGNKYTFIRETVNDPQTTVRIENGVLMINGVRQTNAQILALWNAMSIGASTKQVIQNI